MKTKTLLGFIIVFMVLPDFLKAQSELISLNMHNASLNDVLNEVEKQCNYTFLVNQQIVDINQKVDAVFENATIIDVLDDLYKKENIQYVISNHQIVLTPKKQDQSQQEDFPKKVTGKIIYYLKKFI